jgi:hypothetical protein
VQYIFAQLCTRLYWIHRNTRGKGRTRTRDMSAKWCRTIHYTKIGTCDPRDANCAPSDFGRRRIAGGGAAYRFAPCTCSFPLPSVTHILLFTDTFDENISFLRLVIDRNSGNLGRRRFDSSNRSSSLLLFLPSPSPMMMNHGPFPIPKNPTSYAGAPDFVLLWGIRKHHPIIFQSVPVVILHSLLSC